MSQKTDRAKGYLKGKPTRYCVGHCGRKLPDMDMTPPKGVAEGCCWCGCGTPLPSPRARTTRFIQGHHLRRRPRVKVDNNGCWNWVGTLQRDGYGVYKKDPHSSLRAHRWMWEQMRGPIVEEMVIDHLCRNRACVNPDHLEVVTRSMNSRRGSARLTDAQVIELRREYEQHMAPRLNAGIRIAAGGWTARQAQRLGLSVGTVSTACRGQSYRHLPLANLQASASITSAAA